jgi:hypothetical protein
MVQKGGNNLDNNKFSNFLFQFGRRISMAIESGLIGFLPLLLFALEIASAWAEASLVEQVMPYFEGTFMKALVYTGIGVCAGVFLFPNISWWNQANKFITMVKSDKTIPAEFKQLTLDKLKSARNVFGWTSLFTFIVAAGSHAVTIYFMITAFNNKETLKLLEIDRMGEVPMALAISVSVVGFGLDILLGLTTSTKLRLKDYFPSVEDKESISEAAYEFEELQLEEIKLQKEMFQLRNERNARIESLKKEFGHKRKDKEEGFKNPKDEKKEFKSKDKKKSGKSGYSPSLLEHNSMDQFFEDFFQGKITAKDIATKLEELDENEYNQKYAIPLATHYNNLRELISERLDANDKGSTDTRKIDGKIGSEKGRVIKLFREMGIKLKV